MPHPDGKVYEVVGIASDAALTIAPNYLGSTASAQSYAIQPTRGSTIKYNANAVALLASIQSYIDGPLAGRFPDGSAAQPSISNAGDTNTGIHFPAPDQMAADTGGVTRWLLSNTAFQVNVPITGAASQRVGGLWCTYGGTANAVALTYGVAAVTTGTMVRFKATAANTGPATINLDGKGAIACRTIKGDVLPADYIRTDALTSAWYDGTHWIVDRQIEVGTNANGIYTKYADGRMICKKSQPNVLDASVAEGSIFKSATPYIWDLPADYAASSVAFGGSSVRSSAATLRGRVTSTSTGEFIATSGISLSGNLTIDMIADGPWY